MILLAVSAADEFLPVWAAPVAIFCFIAVVVFWKFFHEFVLKM